MNAHNLMIMSEIELKIKSFLEESEKKNLPPLLVILGATASGKTDFSINIAKKFNGEIISTDSRQIYKMMDIGTAKIKTEEMAGIKHYMLDLVMPDKVYTLAEFTMQALNYINDIHKRGKLPVLVGGTGLYIRAICENYNIPSVPPDPKLREKLWKDYEEKGSDYVYGLLLKLDKKAATRIHPNNHRYVIRAIERAKAGACGGTGKGKSKYNVLRIGIEWPREKLYARIDKRAEWQIKNGLIEETRNLLKKGYNLDLPSMSSLGYPETVSYLNGDRTIEEVIVLLQKNTRNYAKRQITWFRREPDVVWVSGEEV